MPKLNLRVKSNENLKVVIAITDDQNQAVDLSGTTAYMTIRGTLTEPDASVPILSINSDEDEEITISGNDVIVDIPFTLVSSWNISDGFYDILIKYASDDQDSLADGKIHISKGSTR